MKAKADTSPEAMRKMVDYFGTFGVAKEQIEKRIQRRIDAIQPAQVVTLKKIAASLRDGMSVAGDWFEPAEHPEQAEQPASRVDQVKAKLRKNVIKPEDNPATGAPEGDPSQPMPGDLV
jgi:hypothetical protein